MGYSEEDIDDECFFSPLALVSDVKQTNKQTNKHYLVKPDSANLGIVPSKITQILLMKKILMVISSHSQGIAVTLRQNCAYMLEKGPVTALEVTSL